MAAWLPSHFLANAASANKEIPSATNRGWDFLCPRPDNVTVKGISFTRWRNHRSIWELLLDT